MNDNGQCAQARPELGVYVLGAIEPAQRALVDRHLAVCPDCRAELAGLAGLPSLLRRVPVAEALQQSPDDAAALLPGPPLTALASRVSRIRRRRWCLTAAAALIAGFAAASGVQALHAAADRPPAAAAPRWAVTAEGANLVTGTWAAVRYATRPWGTELEVRVTGVAAGTRCQFWVTGPRGQDAAAGGWTIAAGDQAAWYPASASFQTASVRSFAVTAGGKTLVTVQAPSSGRGA
ncbi:MAG: anti-sigma factor family protein [Streptosporangiaceae bacterium]